MLSVWIAFSMDCFQYGLTSDLRSLHDHLVAFEKLDAERKASKEGTGNRRMEMEMKGEERGTGNL